MLVHTKKCFRAHFKLNPIPRGIFFQIKVFIKVGNGGHSIPPTPEYNEHGKTINKQLNLCQLR